MLPTHIHEHPIQSSLPLHINSRTHRGTGEVKTKMGRSKMVVIKVIMMLLTVMMVEADSGLEICNMGEADLDACKPAVSKENPTETPSVECCSALSKADLPCFCGYKNSFLLPSLGIDPDLAMKLPGKCNLPVPNTC